MGGMLFNKIAGAGLAVVLVILGLLNLPAMLFSSGGEGHHDDHHGEELSLNEQIAATYAYYIPLADSGSTGPVEPEDVFDLGAALAAADVDRGASSFQQKCASCHSIEAGAPNGIGPNLHNVVGASMHFHDDFRYSSSMSAMEGDWTYAALNDWLKSPSNYISGTSMGFAGLNRDSERANVIAFLASNTDAAPAFPDPLPEVSEEDTAEVPAEETTATESEAELVEPASLEEAAEDAADTTSDLVEEAGDGIEEIVEDAVETVEDVADDAGEHLPETGDEH